MVHVRSRVGNERGREGGRERGREGEREGGREGERGMGKIIGRGEKAGCARGTQHDKQAKTQLTHYKIQQTLVGENKLFSTLSSC